jgi:ATP-dependent RNA helicase DDX47/RRP3
LKDIEDRKGGGKFRKNKNSGYDANDDDTEQFNGARKRLKTGEDSFKGGRGGRGGAGRGGGNRGGGSRGRGGGNFRGKFRK